MFSCDVIVAALKLWVTLKVFVKINICKLCGLSTLTLFGLSTVGMVSPASAQQRNFEMSRKQEIRQRRVEDFRAIRQIERQEKLERQNDKPHRPSIVGERALTSQARPVPPLGQRPLPRMQSLTPEERIALRRQIREAREDIYQKRQQKH